MYIINITYTVPLTIVDTLLAYHIAYLDRQYALGNFLVSGRKVPRTGGIILSNVVDKKELMNIIEQDPFKKDKLAIYEVTEFIPCKTRNGLEFLIG
jgi:uncharacterized protein YciI